MFTGIIQDIGTVLSIDKKGDWRARIETTMDLTRMPIGASIACSGVCLTAVQKGVNWFEVEISNETISKSNISHWQDGTKINLEPSLRIGDELGGHFVYGHVDGLAVIHSIQPSKDSHILWINFDSKDSALIAPKGSVTLDGVALTVNAVEKDRFSVNIIPHTWTHTTLGARKAGDALNIEYDMLARYVLNRHPGESRDLEGRYLIRSRLSPG